MISALFRKIKTYFSSSIVPVFSVRQNFKNKLEILRAIKNQTLFSGLRDQDLKKLLPYFSIETLVPTTEFDSKETKVLENAFAYVLSGKIKAEEQINTVARRASVEYNAGEPINLRTLSHSEAVLHITQVSEPTTLLILSLDRLRQNAYYKKYIESTLLANALDFSSDRIGHVAQVFKNMNIVATRSIAGQLEEVRQRVLFGMFVIRMLIILCLYTLSLRGLVIIKIHVGNSSVVTIGILFVMAGIVYQIMRKTQLPISEFGLSLINWKRSIKESLMASVILILVCTGAKWLLIKYGSASHTLSLFEWKLGLDSRLRILDFETFIFFIMYIIFAPVQEFLVRGGLQGALYSFLSGTQKARMWTAIFVSNLMFISFHSHIAFGFVLLTFVPGIVWGYLYGRHKTLIGVAISHILVGIYTIFILGLSSVM